MTFRNLSTLVLASTVFTLIHPQTAQAKDCSIGQTVFADTVYGMGAGALVGGLWMIADMKNTKDADILPNIATAALIGGGVGAMLGVVEVGMCAGDGRGSSKAAGFQIPAPTFFAVRSITGSLAAAPGLIFRYKFN